MQLFFLILEFLRVSLQSFVGFNQLSIFSSKELNFFIFTVMDIVWEVLIAVAVVG